MLQDQWNRFSVGFCCLMVTVEHVGLSFCADFDCCVYNEGLYEGFIALSSKTGKESFKVEVLGKK